MSYWPSWVKVRITLLSLLALICCTWAALFAILLHHEWSHSSPSQKVVIIGFLTLYSSNAILFYLMAVVGDRPWWDVVRMFSVLVVHTGFSVLFAHKRHSLSCRGFSTETVCKAFISTMFLGCWAFSGISLCFAILLGAMALSDRRSTGSTGSIKHM